MKLLFILGFIVLASCSSRHNSEGRYKLTCYNQTSQCHDKARDLCPNGYLVTNRVRPQKAGKDTIFTLNVKCRDKIHY